MDRPRRSHCARGWLLFLPFATALAMFCLVVTIVNATAGSREFDQATPIIESVSIEPSVWRGEPGWLSSTVRNTGTTTACGASGPGDCPDLLLEIIINPSVLPGHKESGNCIGYVDPIPPGVTQTARVSFTLDPDLPPAGYCPATEIRELWLGLDGDGYVLIRPMRDLLLPLILSVGPHNTIE